ncbi:ATP-binding protein [Actinomadura chibensis]|uniref:Tetratricopeptide repeat protein n=1 Tax=Actinomadura chibensis TaxID=392828 RepID=A0A5D0NGT1_9ACTN|nr:tetratricopeptide repeat protein [Actinomadura chibensis]TYB43552.1 tetratricopeptide repeat protein [Actinomadura chibensis]
MSLVHRSIVCVDIESFGDPGRTDADRLAIRAGLYGVLSAAFDGSGVPWQGCYREDRGDGALILVPSEVSKEVLVTDLPVRLAAELAAHDRTRDRRTRIRLRVAAHAGEVRHDDYGVAGTAINLAFRLLEAEPFKRILAHSSGLLALVVSDLLYASVVRHVPRSAPGSYRRIRVSVKETETDAWVRLPDDPFPEVDAAARTPPPPGERQSPPRQLPAVAAHFTGRRGELARLLDSATEPDRPAGTAAICAIDGMAGVGKTTLAVHAAHRLADRFTDGCLFLDLHGYTHSIPPVSPGEALGRLLHALGVPGERIPHDVDGRAALYRSRLTGSRTLIVLDNATDAEHVRPLLPAEANCLVLVTSRRRLTSLDEALPLSLDVLSPAEGLALFTAGAGSRLVRTGDGDAAERVVELCGRLPLAIRIAAARLRSRPAWTAAHLADRLAEQHGTLAELDDGERDVAAAFALSYRGLTDDQRRMFRRLGLHPGTDTDVHAAASLAGTTAARAYRLCEDLLDAHLLHQFTPDRYQFHDLTRAFASETAAEESEHQRHSALTDLFDHYLATAGAAMNVLYPAEERRRPRVPPVRAPIAPVSDPAAARAWLDAERHDLVAVCAHSAAHGWPRHATRLAATLFRYLDIGGHLADAQTIYRHARRAAAATGDRTGDAHLLTSLGGVYWNQGHYEHAVQAARQALAIFQATGDRSGQARALSTLGIIYWRQGRYERAADHSRQALALYRDRDDPAGEARALSNLCLVQWRQGDHEQAVRTARQALARYRGLGDQRGEARIVGNLGNVRHHQGRHEQAVRHHREALALYREIGDRAGEADALTNLALPLGRQGRTREAVHHHRLALVLYRRLGDRNGQARALNGLGEALNELGDTTEARAQHGLALALTFETGDHYEQARAHMGLALTHHGHQAHHHAQQAFTLYTDLNAPEASEAQALLRADQPPHPATEKPSQ